MHPFYRPFVRAFAASGFCFSVLVSSMLTAEAVARAEEYGQTSAPAAKAGNSFNPDLSVDFLGLFRRDSLGPTSRLASDRNGLLFQEAEVQFASNVDPYLRAVALLSVSQANGSADFGVDPEEVFLETLTLPNVTLRAGKFKAALGKHNMLHTHAYPFIDAPMINRTLLGDEGLNEMGVSAAVLLPTSWYSEFTVQGIANNNPFIFNSPNSGDFGGVANLKNLWDLSDDTTLEWALFGTEGPNQYLARSWVYGSDLIVRWRPSEGGKYHSLIWQTEYLAGDIQGNPAGEKLGGLATWLQYQFAERWWVQARGEFDGLPHDQAMPTVQRQSGLLGFFPSEFSGFRLQYDHTTGSALADDHRVQLQWNIVIGAHPAHAY